jgi:hypothetical protein
MALSDKTYVAIASKMTEISQSFAFTAPKLFQMDNVSTKRQIVSLLAFFNKTIKVKEELQPHEIIILTQLVMEKYSHESVEDILLALKDAIFGGYKFFGKISIQDITAILETYFEKKAIWLEGNHQSQKFASSSDRLFIGPEASEELQIALRSKLQSKVVGHYNEWRQEINELDEARKEAGL